MFRTGKNDTMYKKERYKMENKEVIKILDNIYKMLDDENEALKEYVTGVKLNLMASSNNIETYVDNILSKLK